jgi:hypothetical protein
VYRTHRTRVALESPRPHCHAAPSAVVATAWCFAADTDATRRGFSCSIARGVAMCAL